MSRRVGPSVLRSRYALPPLALLLVGAVAPSLRYGDPVTPPPRPPLATRGEALARRLAGEASRPEGASTLVVDPRLEVALDRLLAKLPPSGPPPGGVSEQALWITGIVEPVPYLLTMVVPAGADDDVVSQLERVLPPVLAPGRYRRVAVAMAPLRDGATRLALALQESFVEMRPVARALPAGGKAALAGRVLAPFSKPELFVTAPDGSVSRLLAQHGGDPRTFSATFQCGARVGAWQIEVAAEDRLGDTVLANFPVYCGVSAPSEIVAPSPPPERTAGAHDRPAAPAPGDVRAAAEAQVLELLQKDRAAAGLPPLIADARLVAVARAHSLDMRDHSFFGHLSPSTGSAMDRLVRAGVSAVRVRENLGRAYSALEIERGLMGSPSHRANILGADVDRVGIGVAVGAFDAASGTHDLYLTQLFVRLPERFDPARALAALRARMAAIRHDGHAPPVGADPALDRVAVAVASGLASGALDPAHPAKDDPVERALPSLSGRYQWVRKVTGNAIDVAQFGASSALLDPAVTHAGYAVAAGPPDAAGSTPLWLVVLLAARR